ncbi:phage tail protein [Sinorhizobium medicae]|uniref:phage tail protein n=1 Tax=Sinorhizobium medicae TaxID=110321 RepID=UPI000FD255C9|nr:phage tail protein [Sinorhizobium medicae]RVJ23795.1 phage tail protein [Sinorhizobium medicae]
MAQHDQIIADAAGLAFRNDINAALAALFSSSSGAAEPTVKAAGQLWFNSTSGVLQVRNSANTAWQSLTGSLGGSITVSSPITFTGTSAGVGTGLIAVQDARTTLGEDGNAVFAINKQNSATHGLMLGNDGNGAALIGNNNAALRFGKWVSGVFTEYLNMNTSGAFELSGGLVIDPPSAVMGLQIGQSDAHSGRLFLTSTSVSWALVAWDTDQALTITSGGTYGTSTGTTRAKFYPTGVLSVGSYMDALSFQVSAGFNGVRRGLFQAKTTAGGGIAYVQSFDDTGTVDAQLEVSNSTLNFRSMMTQPTSQIFRMSEADGQRRVDMYWDANYGLVIYARDTLGAAIGYIAIRATGELVCNDGTTTADVLTTANYPAASTASTANTVAQRDASGDINARLFRSEYDSTNATVGFIMTQIDTVSNNYIRPSTPAQVAAALDGLVGAEVYTGTSTTNTSFPIGSMVATHCTGVKARNSTVIVCIDTVNSQRFIETGMSGAGTALAGTWRARGKTDEGEHIYLLQRVA